MIQIPTEDECLDTALAGHREAFQGSDPPVDLSTDGFLGQLARATVSSTYSVLVAVAAADRDAVPNENSSFESLAQWAVDLGLSNGVNPGEAPYGPLIPQAAVGGAAVPTGSVGTVIPEGATLVDPTGQVTVAIYGAGTLPLGGGQKAAVNAVTSGEAGNLRTGTVLSWVSAPVGADPTVTLVSGLSGGTDGETADNPQLLLGRIRFRQQHPPGSGRASDFRVWAETVADQNGTPIAGLRAYVYPLREGLGTVDILPLLPGDGEARIPTVDQIAAIQAAVDRRRPVCSRAYVLEATISFTPLRDLTILVLADPTLARYGWDFDDGGGLTTIAWVPGPPTMLRFSGVLPQPWQDAIDLYKRKQAPPPRLQVASLTGPEVPLVVSAIDYANGVPSTITVVAPLGFVPPTNGDMVYAASAFSAQAAQGILDYVNTAVGPGRGLYADPDDIWDDTVRISRITQIVNDTLDTDGSPMALVKSPVLNGCRIAAGAGLLQARDVQASGGGLAKAPELLIVRRVLVVQR